MSKIHKTYGEGSKKPPYNVDVLVWSNEWSEWHVDCLQEGADGDYWFHTGSDLDPDIVNGEYIIDGDHMRPEYWTKLPGDPRELN